MINLQLGGSCATAIGLTFSEAAPHSAKLICELWLLIFYLRGKKKIFQNLAGHKGGPSLFDTNFSGASILKHLPYQPSHRHARPPALTGRPSIKLPVDLPGEVVGHLVNLLLHCHQEHTHTHTNTAEHSKSVTAFHDL